MKKKLIRYGINEDTWIRSIQITRMEQMVVLDNDGLDNLGEYMTTTSPNNPDTDQDTVQDGQDMCPMTPGAGTDGCPTETARQPATYSIQWNLMESLSEFQ